MSVVLASASPRRLELLKMIGIEDLEVIPSHARETGGGDTPEENVTAIALEKCRDIAAGRDKNDIVIAADTLVYLDDIPLGKPRSKAQAIEMLMTLSGRHHRVHTGVAVIKGDMELTACESADVYFRAITPEEAAAYAATGEPMDKAGAYCAQGIGAYFIEKIHGDFFTVMGLPLCRLGLMLKEVGLEIPSAGGHE